MPKLRISGKYYPIPVLESDIKRLLMLKDLFVNKKLTSTGLCSQELAFIGWLALEFPDTGSITNSTASDDFFDLFNGLINKK